jgi:hypothetical protein
MRDWFEELRYWWADRPRLSLMWRLRRHEPVLPPDVVAREALAILENDLGYLAKLHDKP